MCAHDICSLVFPEPFVWYIFHGLAEALLFLESGQTTPGAAADPTWRPIFHADIKPANILLYHEETGNGAHTWHGHYPMPLLTDFGGAESYPHPNATDQVPSHILGMGTDHFVPFVSDEPGLPLHTPSTPSPPPPKMPVNFGNIKCHAPALRLADNPPSTGRK